MSLCITAQPYDYELPRKENVALMIIDMQRDFLEPGGFGESLGNDVSRLQGIVPIIQALRGAFNHHNLTIIQTKRGINWIYQIVLLLNISGETTP